MEPFGTPSAPPTAARVGSDASARSAAQSQSRTRLSISASGILASHLSCEGLCRQVVPHSAVPQSVTISINDVGKARGMHGKEVRRHTLKVTQYVSLGGRGMKREIDTRMSSIGSCAAGGRVGGTEGARRSRASRVSGGRVRRRRRRIASRGLPTSTTSRLSRRRRSAASSELALPRRMIFPAIAGGPARAIEAVPGAHRHRAAVSARHLECARTPAAQDLPCHCWRAGAGHRGLAGSASALRCGVGVTGMAVQFKVIGWENDGKFTIEKLVDQ